MTGSTAEKPAAGGGGKAGGGGGKAAGGGAKAGDGGAKAGDGGAMASGTGWLSDRPRLRRSVLALLVLSFLLNATALLVPFIVLEKALSGSTPYNLLRTVVLMWESGLHLLAVIITAFSILFPFAKLVVLVRLTLVARPGERDGKLLEVVEALGKWSMIDVFIVCFVLALTSDQVFVGATARPGIYAFLLAILLSMLCGELLARAYSGAGSLPGIGLRRATSLGAAAILLLASAAFAGLLVIPFLAIDDWLLADRSFTLATFAWALLRQGAPVIAVFLLLSLVIAPAFEILAAWVLWWRARVKRQAPGWTRALSTVRRWSMLDVFLLALLVFLAEGESLISVEPGWGIALLAVISLVYTAHLVLRRRLLSGFPLSALHEDDEKGRGLAARC